MDHAMSASIVSPCKRCKDRTGAELEFSVAFQPIVDLDTGGILSYEALVRGVHNEPAHTILTRVDEQNRYSFDQAVRVRVVEMAAHLGVTSGVNINFMPGAVYKPEVCIRTTLEAARRCDFPLERIVFEVTESEKIEDHKHLNHIIKEYQRLGFKTAIDDFGAGYSGLNLLAEFQPDYVKLDMELTRNIHVDRVRQAIVRGIIDVCHEIAIEIIAEGIEQHDEVMALRDLGVRYYQGYYFARPAFESLPPVNPELLLRYARPSGQAVMSGQVSAASAA